MSRRRQRGRRDLEAAVIEEELLEVSSEPMLVELKAVIANALDDVPPSAVLVQALTAGKARPRMVVLGAEALAAAAAQRENDRQARAARRRRNEPLGQAWLRVNDDAKHHGPTAAPANVAAVSLADEIARTLHRILIDLTDYDRVKVVPKLAGLQRVVETVEEARTLAWSAGEAARPALERTIEALADLDKHVRPFIEQQGQRSHLRRYACIHCGRHSLIRFHDQNFTRCDRVPGQEHYQPCTCRNALCECKHRPVAYRHTWYAAKPASSPQSEQYLGALLKATQGTPEERSRSHQP